MRHRQHVARAPRALAITATVAILGLAMVAVGGLSLSPARAHIDDTWFWTPQSAANAVYTNDIAWKHRFDVVKRDTCWGFGRWIGTAQNPKYRHFFCTVKARKHPRYTVFLHVLSRKRYSISWDGYLHDPDAWFWSEKRVADALYQNGIRWSTGTDPVSSDTCWGFGNSIDDSPRLYRHMYCKVVPTNDDPYAVIVPVRGERMYKVIFEGYLPASSTPAPPPPQYQAPAANSFSLTSQFVMNHAANRILFGTDSPPMFGPPPPRP